MSGGGVVRSNDDSVRVEKVSYGGAFGEEFGVGKDLEWHARAMGFYL